MSAVPGCKICGKPVRARKWCATHYEKWRTHGDPLYVAPRASCGTDAGAQAHRRRDEDLCEPCKAAAAERLREYRSDPAVKEATNHRNAATHRALWRLSREHLERFRELLAEEMDRGNEAEEEAEDEEIHWVRRGGILVRSGGDAA